MNLVDVLSCGVRGAKYGTAVVYARGTTTAAAVYADHAGKARRWGTIHLDAFGSVQAYVNTAVDVVVYDKDGDEIRSFTEGTSDRCVEVLSDSFTGTDYEDATSAAGDPTTLERVLAMVKTSFGTTDFNVLVGSTAVSLQAALSGLAGVFYNVKDIEFGATGDGTSDDTLELQSAINAADLAGGGIVFVPPGTYLVSQELTVPSTVSIIGCGAQISVIKVTSDLARALHFTGYGASAAQRLEKLGIKASVAHSASLITAVRGANLTIRACDLGDSNCTGPLFELQATNAALSTDRGHVRILGSIFTAGGTAEDVATFGRCIDSYAAAGTARVDVSNCTFVAPVSCGETNGITMVYGLCVHLRGCYFDHTAYVSGDMYDIVQGGSHSWGSAIGCVFSATGNVLADVVAAISAVMTDTSDWYCDIGNFATQSGEVEATRVITQGDTGTSYGYYCKSDAARYYEETAYPELSSAIVTIGTPSFTLPAGILACDMTDASANSGIRMVSSRSVQGDRFTLVGYNYGYASVDLASDSSDATFTRHSAVPGIDSTVGSGYFGMEFRMLRTYGLPGPALRTKWYCVGVGGSTKTGLARTSY